MRLTAIAAILLLSGALACDRRTAAWVPIEQEPAAPAKPVQIPGLEAAEVRGDVPMPGRGAAPSERAMAGAPAAAPSSSEVASGPGLRGTLKLADGATAPAGVLFLIARTGPPPQPPLAVKRLPAGPFPMEFEIGPGDVMIPGRRFEGAITLTARLDTDGNASSSGPNDLQGAAPSTVQPGTTGIEIVLAGGSR